jgi:hypothetical protein
VKEQIEKKYDGGVKRTRDERFGPNYTLIFIISINRLEQALFYHMRKGWT